VHLSKEERNLLESNIKPTTQYRFIQHVKVVLLASEGFSNNDIAEKIELSLVSLQPFNNLSK